MNGIDASMFELFRDEVKAHADALGTGLVAVEARPTDPALLEELMRAAHSIKGAARIVGIDTAVRLAHVMEDALVAAQDGKIRLTTADVDVLLRGADALAGLAALTPNTTAAWEQSTTPLVESLEPLLIAIAKGVQAEAPAPPSAPEAPPAAREETAPEPAPQEPNTGFPTPPRFELPTIPATPFDLRPDHSMLDLFREESRECLGTIAKALPHLTADPTAAEPVLDALKHLRGAARLVKCAPIADAVTAISAFVRASREAGTPLSPHAVEWAGYAIATLAGVLATDDETFGEWADAARPALAAVANTFTGARSGPTPPAPPSLKGRGENSSFASGAPDSESAREGSFSPLPFREGGPGG